MCDLDTQKDAEEFLNSNGKLNRRKKEGHVCP